MKLMHTSLEAETMVRTKTLCKKEIVSYLSGQFQEECWWNTRPEGTNHLAERTMERHSCAVGKLSDWGSEERKAGEMLCGLSKRHPQRLCRCYE